MLKTEKKVLRGVVRKGEKGRFDHSQFILLCKVYLFLPSGGLVKVRLELSPHSPV